MKKGTLYEIGDPEIFYVSLGCFGYLWCISTCFGIPQCMLQVYAQPIYAKYEGWLAKRSPDSTFFHKVYEIPLLFSKSRSFCFTLSKLILRSLFVVLTTCIVVLLSFFNAVVGLLGPIAFWPLTVYFLVTIYISQMQIKRRDGKWIMLQGLIVVPLVLSLLAAVSSVADIGWKLQHVKLFKAEL